jgi:hypothetical protein
MIRISYIQESALRGQTPGSSVSRVWTSGTDPWRVLPSSTTTAELYRLLSEECKNERIRIWYCDITYQKPGTLIANDPAKLIKSLAFATDSVHLFVQPLRPDEPLEVGIDKRMAYLKFFFPSASMPIQFLMSVALPISEPITMVYAKVNEFLGFPSGTPLGAFVEDFQGVRRMQEDVPLSKICFSHGIVIILQVTPPNPVPPITTEFTLAESDSPVTEVAEEESPLPRVLLGINDPASVETYIANLTRLQIDVYDQENPDTALFLLETPQKTLFVDVKVAIGEFLQHPYDPAKDAILLATAVPVGNGLQFTPADNKVWPALQYRFAGPLPAGWTRHRLYFRWLQGVPEAMAGSFTTPLITFSEDARTMVFGQQLTIAKTGKCADLVARLAATHDIGTGPYRVLFISDHQITSIMREEDDYTIGWSVPVIRIERVPESQRVFEGTFMTVTFCIVDSGSQFGYLKATGDPVVAPVAKGAVWADTKLKVAEFLGLHPSDDAWKFGTLYAYNQLKDTDPVSQQGKAVTPQGILMIIGAAQGKPARRGEASVRIYN